MNFRVGQKVVCVDVNCTHGPWDGYAYPQLNAVYTVRSKFTNCDGSPCIRLVEIKNPELRPGFEPGFGADHFRPAVSPKTDISTFTKILDDVSAGRVREIAGV